MLYLTVTLNVLSAFQNTMYVALSATYIQVFWKLILEINFQTIAVFFFAECTPKHFENEPLSGQKNAGKALYYFCKRNIHTLSSECELAI